MVDPDRPLKIAYLCDRSPEDAWSYSGGNKRIYDVMRSKVGEVSLLDPTWGVAEPAKRLVEAMPEAISMRARWRVHLALSSLISRSVTRQLAAGDFDVVFGVYGLQAMANLHLPKPMLRVFTSDATQTSYRTSEVGEGFGTFFKPGRLLDQWVLGHETRALQANDLNFWPSDWQKEAADQCYGLDDAKSVVVPWGANIEAPDAGLLRPDLDFENGIHLLLVGRDWHAKGGPLAVDVLRILRAKGVDARLRVVGCVPPENDMSAFMDVYPRLDKSVPNELETFESLFRDSHFMIQPSLESYGFAFCEASAFGLPSLCLRRGGIPVWDGVNGHALPMGQTAENFAQVVLDYQSNPETYQSLRESTRACFEDKLNWDAWAHTVKHSLLDLRKQIKT